MAETRSDYGLELSVYRNRVGTVLEEGAQIAAEA